MSPGQLVLSADQKIPFRLDLQGLRAIAIAIVVLAHANVPAFSGGFVGVDVFFVLSGFLITGLLVQERLTKQKIHYGRFLARRLRRLLPALLVMLVVVLWLSLLLLSSYEARMQTGSFLYATTWTSNFYFAFAEFDYFAALQAKDLFLHTWSLGIEEQFYIVWPWVIALSFLVLGASSNPHLAYKALLAVILLVFAGSLAVSLYWSQTSPLLSFYMMPSRGWQFALGAFVFVYARMSQAEQSTGPAFWRSALVSQCAGITGLLLIIGSALVLHAELTYPGYFAIFPSAGAALLIFAGLELRQSVVNDVLRSKALVWLGDRSYSLYLWHWPVLLLGGAYGLANEMAGVLALVGVSIILAMLSYRFVEKPVWKGRYSQVSPRVVVLTSLLAVTALFQMSQLMIQDSFTGTAVAEKRADDDSRLDAPAVFKAGFDCDSWYWSSDVVPCTSGDDSARNTAVLIGDSIGAQWASFLPEIYQAPDWRIFVLTKSSCAIADVEYYYKPVGGLYDVCTDWRNGSIDYIAGLKPDVVFVGTSARNGFSASQWVGGTQRILERLAAVARHVVVIPGTPALSFDGPSCIKEPYRFTRRLRDSKNFCEEKLKSNVTDQIARHLEKAAIGVPNAHVMNLNDLVCPERRCAARTSDGLAVFRDDQHLTASFVLAQVSDVLSRLDAIGAGPSLAGRYVDSMVQERATIQR